MKKLKKVILLFLLLYRKITNKYINLNFIDDNDVLQVLKNNKVSLARFGDGELNIIFKGKGIHFQKNDERLKSSLKEVLDRPTEKVLIGLPLYIKDDKDLTFDSKLFWAGWITKNFKYLNNINKNIKYANTNITRPYMGISDKSKTKKIFLDFKEIWNNKDVVIIEGDKTKFGIGNDLLSNSKSISRIICPSTNAFNKLDEIITFVKKNISNDSLLLIALGPTATVLAYRLSDYDYQSIDIGHLDVEYEWYKLGTNEKVEIKGKFVNESAKKYIENEDVELTKAYESTIIHKVI